MWCFRLLKCFTTIDYLDIKVPDSGIGGSLFLQSMGLLLPLLVLEFCYTGLSF